MEGDFDTPLEDFTALTDTEWRELALAAAEFADELGLDPSEWATDPLAEPLTVSG